MEQITKDGGEPPPPLAESWDGRGQWLYCGVPGLVSIALCASPWHRRRRRPRALQ
jgi:hypothetical protein